MSKITFEVSHAKKDGEDIIVVMTEMGKMYSLGSKEDALIATELGPEWFEGSMTSWEDYASELIENSDPSLVEKVNTLKIYQNQLWSLLGEEARLNDEYKEAYPSHSMDLPPRNTRVFEENLSLS